VFKAKVALAALEGTETLTQLAERVDIHAHQIAQWRSQLVARAAEVFAAAEDRRAAAPGIRTCAAGSRSRARPLPSR